MLPSGGIGDAARDTATAAAGSAARQARADARLGRAVLSDWCCSRECTVSGRRYWLHSRPSMCCAMCRSDWRWWVAVRAVLWAEHIAARLAVAG